ncbi:TIGR02677 family protein [Clostridium sporogenes]|nr:TIGR02677 family protein [Clostridium sporogenes]NFS25348.1 TIGR02677 family protein [Clostridium sporogenes]
MFLDGKLKKEVIETRYLSVENTWRYRAIIRIMFKNYEKMNFWLLKEQIYEELIKYEDFKKYGIEILQQDLEALVNWGNLLTMYDTRKMRTIEEFKNKQYKYQVSPYTVEIERMLIRLESLKEENRGSLERTLVERFKEELEKITTMVSKESNQIYDWWKRLNRDFKILNENYQDYISKFYSPKNEELMKTTQFLIFKESFISYLRDFIKGLQINSSAIRNLLERFDENIVDIIIGKVLEYEKSLPMLEEDLNEEFYIEKNKGRFYSIKSWFLGEGSQNSMADQILDSTNEIIRKITRYAMQLTEMKYTNGNRKEEYKKIAEIFSKCLTIEEADKLSAVVFGVFKPRHIKGNPIRETESISSSIYEEKPYHVTVKPRIRQYREKTASRVAVKDKSEEKRIKIQRIIAKREEEKILVESLIKNNKIIFGELETISKNQRSILLRWLSKGRTNKNGIGKTEYGKVYKVEQLGNGDYITLYCNDGEFKMPNYSLIFIN